jgi:uncharacterized protein
MTIARASRGLLLLTVTVVLAGCATYSDQHGELRPLLARADYDAALAKVADLGGKDRLLQELERGLLLHYAGRWAESNAAFAAAELLADDLYTRSLSEGALSLFTNDTAISYRARPFELALVPYYRVLNYVSLGEPAEAAVEGRKASQLLARYVDATAGGVAEEQRDDFEATKNDGFLLHLSGMLYDEDGETNDAFIAYRNAAFAYAQNAERLGLQIPPALAGDLERTASQLGFATELAEVREACPAVWAAADTTRGPALAAGQGEVVLFVETGFVPARRQERLDLPIFTSDDRRDADNLAVVVSGRYRRTYSEPERAKIAYWLSVAVPELSVPPQAPGEVVVSAGSAPVRGVRAANLAALAQISFEAEFGKILLKTVARGLTKYLGTHEAKKAGEGWGVLANLLAAATETADTRSWLTLPQSIYLVRLTLPAGEHTLRATVDDGSGQAWDVTIPDVVVRDGGWTFLSQRLF